MSNISIRINRHYLDQNWSMWAKFPIYEGIDKIPEICPIDNMGRICQVGQMHYECPSIWAVLLHIYLNTYI